MSYVGESLRDLHLEGPEHVNQLHLLQDPGLTQPSIAGQNRELRVANARPIHSTERSS